MFSSSSPSSSADVGAVRVASADELRRHGSKVHAEVKGRYVSVFNLRGKFYCLDAVCYHAGGPLTVGDVEDIGGKACVVCPWHNYCVTVETGEKLYQALVRTEDGKMVAGGWDSIGVRQRTHRAFEKEGSIYVQLDEEGKVESDKYAKDPACGKRLFQGHGRMRSKPNRASPFNVGKGRGGTVVGADGRLPAFLRKKN